MGIISSLTRLFSGSTEQSNNNQRDVYARRSDSTPSTRQEIEDLAENVYDSDYIANLRIGRSWILPQMVDMCFDYDGNFSESRYYQQIEKRVSYDDCWTILIRNLKALAKTEGSDSNEYRGRARWWTKEVAVSMAKEDFEKFQEAVNRSFTYNKCKGGPYKYITWTIRGRMKKHDRMFFLQTPPSDYKNLFKSKNETLEDLFQEYANLIQKIENANSPQELYSSIKEYDSHRGLFYHSPGDTINEEFVNAYVGDGAYNAMMTMVKYLNLIIPGSLSTRESSIDEIERKADAVRRDGKQLFSYCCKNFFDKSNGGMFDYHNYKRR